jgi:flagellar biosynthetic protein FliS
LSAALRYGNVQATTASPERLMVLAFETALRHMRAAATCFDTGRKSEGVLLCTKASDIVVHLHSTLDPRHAPALCADLAAIYQFTCARLILGATSGRAVPVREAERAFAPLVDGFSGAVDQVLRGA